MSCSSSPIERTLVVRALSAFGGLLVARALGVFRIYFYEEDEISLAAGVAALVRENIGDLYRYTPQWGYYRIVELIDRIAGADVALIPHIMKAISVFSGALLPVLGLFLFTSELSLRRRWLAVLLLAINPIVWKTSQYGNTGLFAATLAVSAVAILSNRPARRFEAGALLLFGVSVLVRADAVLLTLVVFSLVWRNRGSFRAALSPCVGFGVALLAAYWLIFVFDPRIDDATTAVVTHFRATRDHFFWEYLIWAISPIPLFLAVWGFRALLDERPALLVLLFCWMLPPFAFYFGATSTPRYFLLTAAPLAIAAAVGVDEAAERIKTWTGSRMAWLAVLGLATAHLFVGLGHFHGRLLSPFLGPSIITHDRGMPTGSLLYDAYFRGGFLESSIRNPGFGMSPSRHWEGPLFREALTQLRRDRIPERCVLMLLHSGWGHAFHFHAQAAGVSYVSREAGSASQPFRTLTRLEVGGHPVLTVGRSTAAFAALDREDFAGVDEVWVSGRAPFPTAEEQEKLPAGLRLVRTMDDAGLMRIYSVDRSSE